LTTTPKNLLFNCAKTLSWFGATIGSLEKPIVKLPHNTPMENMTNKTTHDATTRKLKQPNDQKSKAKPRQAKTKPRPSETKPRPSRDHAETKPRPSQDQAKTKPRPSQDQAKPKPKPKQKSNVESQKVQATPRTKNQPVKT
jgi:hypothetical protein